MNRKRCEPCERRSFECEVSERDVLERDGVVKSADRRFEYSNERLPLFFAYFVVKR